MDQIPQGVLYNRKVRLMHKEHECEVESESLNVKPNVNDECEQPDENGIPRNF